MNVSLPARSTPRNSPRACRQAESRNCRTVRYASASRSVLQDVTRLRRFHQLKNDLVATVAHEFRTPLTSLRMAIHLCIEQVAGPLTEKQADLLYAGREDCGAATDHRRRAPRFRRHPGGKMEMNRKPISVATLVESAADAYQIAARNQQILLEVEALPSLGDVLADPERVEPIFSDLLANALRHTPSGGTVILRDTSHESTVKFEVADTGEGIPFPVTASTFSSAFSGVPGSQPDRRRFGGLSIAKEIVQAHGGEIGVESHYARRGAATFWFTLPRAAEPT